MPGLRRLFLELYRLKYFLSGASLGGGILICYGERYRDLLWWVEDEIGTGQSALLTNSFMSPLTMGQTSLYTLIQHTIINYFRRTLQRPYLVGGG